MKIASVTVAGVIIFTASTVLSEDRTGQITSALFENMSVTFVCRKVIGDAHYLAAKTDAKSRLATLVGSKQAIQYVDEMDLKLKADARADKINVEAGSCHTLMLEAKHRLEVEQAKHTN